MRTPFRLVSAFALVLLIVAACAAPSTGEPPALVLTDEACNRTGTETLLVGATQIAVRNESGALGSFDLVRLDASFPELFAWAIEQQARLASGELPEGIPPFVTVVGHLLLNPMGSGTIDATLTPGLHAVVCTRLAASDEAALSIFLVGPYSVSE